MLRPDYYETIKNRKPQRPVTSVVHTKRQALEKVLALQQLGYILQHSKTYNSSMDALTIELLSKICSSFNKYEVDYMIIGGTAVGYYGYTRLSHVTADRPEIETDLDIWYKPNYANRMKIIEAIQEMPFINITDEVKSEIDILKDIKWDDAIQIVQANFKIDLVPATPGLKFEEAVKNVENVILEGIKIPIIGFDDLEKTKTIANRKDIDDRDVEQLRAIRKNKNRHGL